MKHVLSLVSAVAIASTASAQIYASDNFGYNGALTSNGWSAHSGAEGANPKFSRGHQLQNHLC